MKLNKATMHYQCFYWLLTTVMIYLTGSCLYLSLEATPEEKFKVTLLIILIGIQGALTFVWFLVVRKCRVMSGGALVDKLAR